MKAYPKIFAMGTDYISNILLDPVEVTEKVDGSQFAFGVLGGQLICRSKGKLQSDAPDKMFRKAVDYVESIRELLPDDMFFYTEYLQSPSHNNLKYDRVPKNNLVLFGAMSKSEKFVNDYDELQFYAELLGIETIPLIYKGVMKLDQVEGFLNRASFLGGAEIEGFVVKNYSRPFLLGGQPIPLMAGKYVSEKYKEIAKDWNNKHTSRGKWDEFKDSYRTEARWEKAYQHLRDDGLILNEPKDIGALTKEVFRDIDEEEKDNIKNFLYKEFGTDLLRGSARGLAEWYKLKLMREGTAQAS